MKKPKQEEMTTIDALANVIVFIITIGGLTAMGFLIFYIIKLLDSLATSLNSL